MIKDHTSPLFLRAYEQKVKVVYCLNASKTDDSRVHQTAYSG